MQKINEDMHTHAKPNKIKEYVDFNIIEKKNLYFS